MEKKKKLLTPWISMVDPILYFEVDLTGKGVLWVAVGDDEKKSLVYEGMLHHLISEQDFFVPCLHLTAAVSGEAICNGFLRPCEIDWNDE